MYKERIKKLQDTLKENGCDAMVVDDQTNLFYLTGLDLSAGTLIVDKESVNLGANLFVDGRYIAICKEKSPFPVFLSDTHPWHKALDRSVKKIAFDSDKTTYKGFENLKNKLSIDIIPLDGPLERLRGVKDKHEALLLKKAGELGSLGFDYVCSLLKTGIAEIEVARELEIFWKRKGATGTAFDPIIAFGKNSAMPHHRSSLTTLKQGDVVLIDIGVNLNHYRSDMTRTISFGNAPSTIHKIHTVVQRAQKLGLDLCRPGTTLKELDVTVREFIAKEGFGDYFTHGLGHGVGLDIHEFPPIRKPSTTGEYTFADIQLLPGMVITIEPGIYLDGVGGVRIEDTVLITEQGHENLTNRPKEFHL